MFSITCGAVSRTKESTHDEDITIDGGGKSISGSSCFCGNNNRDERELIVGHWSTDTQVLNANEGANNNLISGCRVSASSRREQRVVVDVVVAAAIEKQQLTDHSVSLHMKVARLHTSRQSGG
jgi:hypothetical protein